MGSPLKISLSDFVWSIFGFVLQPRITVNMHVSCICMQKSNGHGTPCMNMQQTCTEIRTQCADFIVICPCCGKTGFCSKYAIFFWRPELSKIALHKKQQVSKTHACMDGACMTWMQKGTRNAWTQKACTHVTARPCMNGNMCAWIREHPWYMNGQTQKRYAWMLCMLVSCAMGALPRRAVASFPRDNWPNYNACMSMKIMHGCLSTCKCQAIASRDWNHEHPPWLTPWACKRSEGMHAAMILITHVVFVRAAAHLPGDSQQANMASLSPVYSCLHSCMHFGHKC